MGRVHVEVCPLGWADEALQETHRSEALQVCRLWPEFLQVWSLGSAPTETHARVNQMGRSENREIRMWLIKQAHGEFWGAGSPFECFSAGLDTQTHAHVPAHTNTDTHADTQRCSDTHSQPSQGGNLESFWSTNQGHFWIFFEFEGRRRQDLIVIIMAWLQYGTVLNSTVRKWSTLIWFLRWTHTLNFDKKKSICICKVLFQRTLLVSFFPLHYCSNGCFFSIHNVKNIVLNGFPMMEKGIWPGLREKQLGPNFGITGSIVAARLLVNAKNDQQRELLHHHVCWNLLWHVKWDWTFTTS